jgi:hypothetical protein
MGNRIVERPPLKTIFTYWNTICPPPFIRACLKTWKYRIPPSWTIVILNERNASKYVGKQFVDDFNVATDPVKFSDALRMQILKEYGGVWMDPSIVIFNGYFLDTYWNELHSSSAETLLYEYKPRTIDPRTPYIENWFIMSKPNSVLIKNWQYEFARAYAMGYVTYKRNVLSKCDISMKNTIPHRNGVYLLQHAIINALWAHASTPYDVILKDAGKSMLKATAGKVSSPHFLSSNTNWNGYYAMKIPSYTRRKFNEYQRNKFITNVTSQLK